MSMYSDIIPGLNQRLVKAIKSVTEKRLDLVNSQLENIIDTANTLQGRGYNHSFSLASDACDEDLDAGSLKRSHFIFELKSELMQKRRQLETLLAEPATVFREEFDFYFKVNEPLN